VRGSVLVVHPRPGRDDAQAPRAARFGCEWAADRSLQPFRENPARTIRDDASEPAGTECNHNSSSLRRKVRSKRGGSGYGSGLTSSPADRAGSGRTDRSGDDQQLVSLSLNALDGEPDRDKRDPTTHDGDSRPVRRSWSAQIASALSQSPRGTPPAIQAKALN
jgi:hypothetical protein